MWSRARAVAYLHDTIRTLEAQTDLSPANPLVTYRLRGLVATLKTWQASGFRLDLVNEPALAETRTRLPQLCADAERAMEKWWCRKALASRTPAATLADFWYLGNYSSLSRAETELAGPDRLRNTVFLGCGALPLTAILLAQADEHARLACVDADADACHLAYQLIRTLNLADRITVEHGRAESSGVPCGAAVICASLLDAPGLYDHLADRGTARVLVRDVEGVFQWLYRPALLPGPAFRETGRTAPSPQRINITRCFEAIATARRTEPLAAGVSST